MITYGKFDLADYADNLIVTDGNLQRLYDLHGDNVYVLPDGERAKTFAEAEKLCKWFLHKGLTRNGRVVAVGGGSVGDLTGFAASIFMRGVSLTLVPTTLLAMVDSAIGGKNAVDLCGIKNAVGTFADTDTFVDVSFLQTLDETQLTSGLGEIVKYRMLGVNVPDDDIAEQVKACAEYKLSLCKRDFYDRGERHILNAGHTVGHALELFYNIPHGIAVADGLYYETEFALGLGICDKAFADKWQNYIKQHFPLYKVTLSALKNALHDKKNSSSDTICFMLANGSGATKAEFTLQQATDILC